MKRVAEAPGVEVEQRTVFEDALDRIWAKRIDFPDAVLLAYAASTGLRPASFDRDLDKFADVPRYDPPE